MLTFIFFISQLNLLKQNNIKYIFLNEMRYNMQVKTIIEFINTYKTTDRDKKVVEAINNYYRNNADA